MSERPQAAREEQEDLLEQIIAQGLEKIKTPAQTAAAEPPPEADPPASGPEDGGEALPSAKRKNKRSAVYLYLLILFGAAFLMLLLAYFVQQRSSEDTISDLRDSMSLSRNELFAQIQELDTQNVSLIGEVDRLNGELTRLRQRYEETSQEAEALSKNYYDAQEALYAWDSFWTLEQYYHVENYEICAVILLLLEQGEYTYHTPSAVQARYQEIVRAVIDAGILDEEYSLHPEDYQALLDAYSSP